MENEYSNNQNSEIMLSVVIPVYNVAEFLEECIESVRAQSYTNLEIILVDDGSSDNSPEICDDFAVKDSRIKTIHKTNGGLSSARNAGIEAATGQYITFVDSDDVILGNDTYEKLMDILLSDNNIDIIQYDVIHKYDSQYAHKRSYPFKTYSTKEDMLNGYLNMLIHVSCCDKIFKSIVFNTLRFPEKQISEDIAVIKDIVSNVSVIKTTDIGYYGYRYREGSITNSALPINKIISILNSYYKFHSYAFTFLSLRTRVLESHAILIWSYMSIVRRQHPKEIGNMCRLPIFLNLSLSKWMKYSKGLSNKDKLKSFVVCVLGPRWITRFQRFITRD